MHVSQPKAWWLRMTVSNLERVTVRSSRAGSGVPRACVTGHPSPTPSMRQTAPEHPGASRGHVGCDRLLILVLLVVLGPVLSKGAVVPHSRHELGFGPDS